ncbi:hypothetical protein KAR28_06130 [Candidatus Parcubacteria bacterium]|nr:hypothetical protein [Candidatus Parcubacteria bacterium]
MFKKAINFIKYNNFAVLILAVIFIASTGVWAQTDAGQEFIGEKQIASVGVDNTLLLEADLDNFDMDFKIEKITKNDKYYFVTYTYLDLAKKDDTWEYILNEKVRKVSKGIKKDLGFYLAEELREEHEHRVKKLKEEQARASELGGKSTRMEVSEYSGLIGATLDTLGRVFDGYEPVKIREIPSPSAPLSVLTSKVDQSSPADDLTDIYNDYISANDPDRDDVFGLLDNCPNDYNPEQKDKDNDGLGDACDLYFTLTPVEDDDATSSEETATSTDDNTDSRQQTVDDSSATSSDDIVEDISTSTEPDVIIVDINEVVSTTTN